MHTEPGIELEDAQDIVRESRVPDNSPLLYSAAESFSRDLGVRILSLDPDDQHCRCCSSYGQSVILTPGKVISVSGKPRNVFIFLDLLNLYHQ